MLEDQQSRTVPHPLWAIIKLYTLCKAFYLEGHSVALDLRHVSTLPVDHLVVLTIPDFQSSMFYACSLPQAPGVSRLHLNFRRLHANTAAMTTVNITFAQLRHIPFCHVAHL